MNIDLLGMFKVWVKSPNNRFYPILLALFFAFFMLIFKEAVVY